MKFLPFENITYRTRLSPQEVIRKLSLKVDLQGFYLSNLFKGGKLYYYGRIEGNTFKISPTSRWKNRKFITIKGELNTDNGETIINVKIGLDLYTKIFAAIGLLHLAETSVFSTPEMLTFATVIYLFMILGFDLQRMDSKEYLAALFKAEIENTSNTSSSQNTRYKK